MGQTLTIFMAFGSTLCGRYREPQKLRISLGLEGWYGETLFGTAKERSER